MAIKRVPGTPTDAALAQPFVGSALPRMPGLPIGVNTRTGRPLIFDPWHAHRQQIVDSAVFLVTGNKGRGKSTFQKALAVRYSARLAGYNRDGSPRQMRIRINDRKPPSGGELEYAKLVEYLHGDIVDLSRQAINVFDPAMKMDEDDLVETAVNICEMVSGRSPLPRYQNLALRLGVWKMLKHKTHSASPELLEAVLLSMGPDDPVRYYEETNSLAAVINIPWTQFVEDASLAAAQIGEVLHGQYGSIFGGSQSLRDFLTAPVVLLDWTGVSEKARTLLSAMLWKWQSVAQRNNDQDLIPDLLFTDEEHQALRNLMYVRFMSASLKEARALRTAYFMSTQHETDLTMAGEPDSEIRNLSESIRLSIGGRFIFTQPDNQRVLDLYREMGFSEEDTAILPRLQRGSYFFHAPGHSAIPVRLDLTQIEVRLSDTEGAVRSMTDLK